MSGNRPPYSYEIPPTTIIRAGTVETTTLNATTGIFSGTLNTGTLNTGSLNIAAATITDLSATQVETQSLVSNTDITFKRNLFGNLNTNTNFAEISGITYKNQTDISDISARTFVLEQQELAIDDVSQRLLTLSGRVTTEISRLDSDISDLSGRTDDLSSYTDIQVSRLDTDISDVSGRLDDLSSHVDVQVSRIDTTILDVSQRLFDSQEQDDTDISDISGRLDDLSSHVDLQVSLLDIDISDLSGRITTINDTLDETIQDNLVPLQGIVADLSSRVDTDISDLSGRITTINDTLDETIQDNLVPLQGIVADLSSRVDTDISDLSGRITTINDTLDETIQDNLVPLQGIVADLSASTKEDLSNVNASLLSDISDVSGRVESLEEKTDDISSQLNSLETVLFASVSDDTSGFISVSGESTEDDLSFGSILFPSTLNPVENIYLILDGKSTNSNFIKINTTNRQSSFHMYINILDVSGQSGITLQTFDSDNFDSSANSIFRTGETLSLQPTHEAKLNAHSVGTEAVFTSFEVDVITTQHRDESIVIVKDFYTRSDC